MRTRIPLAAALAALGVVAGTGPATAAASAAPAGGPETSAVVAVRPGVHLPLAVPGGRVVAAFPHIGSELVHAPAAALAALRTDRRVAGVSPDLRGTVTGTDGGDGGSAVLAPTVLGGVAGRPGTGRHVNVALLDTGVSDTAALNRASGRITDGVDVSHLAADGTARTSGRFTDGFGHGTFLASLIAGGRVKGSGSRAIGVAPAARIVVVKVADSRGRTTLSQVLAGFDWVAAHARAIQVVNVALAVQRPTAPAYGADPLTAAVEHVRAAGVVVVAAAGNDRREVGDPGMDPQALTVGAANVSDAVPRVSRFSGRGVVAGVTKPDVVAPGEHVLGVMPPNTVIARTHPEGWQRDGLFLGSGTSEATAVTSGVVAAYLSEHRDATPVQAKAAIRDAAVRVSGAGAGRGLVRPVPAGAPTPPTADAGESHFDAHAWNDAAWQDGNWVEWLASSWSGDAWDASSWSADTWKASSWSASSWSASSWSASSWSASSWSASSWSASSWSASSWSDYAWGDSR